MTRVLILFLILTSCAGSPEGMLSESSAGQKVLAQQSVLQDSSCTTGLYDEFRRLTTEGPLIPGLNDSPVPQGMAYLKEADLMVISNYMSDGSAGVLTVLNMNDGTLEKVISLYNHDRTPHTGHLGGLAFSRDYLWIASGRGVYYVSIEDIINAEDGETIVLPPLIETETKGSFATFSKGILWIGEFTREDGSYPAAESHHRKNSTGGSHRAWLGGYKLHAQTDMINTGRTSRGRVLPDLIISIPDEIQGAVFHKEKLLLSASYGRKNFSRLYQYRSPVGEPAHSAETIFPDKETDFWLLDEKNLERTVLMPPMSEAIALYKDNFAILFESAASKYRETAQCPLERIYYLADDALESAE